MTPQKGDPGTWLKQPRTWASWRYRAPYAVTCLPDLEWQRGKLESLRWRFGDYQHGTRVLRRLAAWGARWGLDSMMKIRSRF